MLRNIKKNSSTIFLDKNLEEVLNHLRKQRNFDTSKYIDAKITAINTYMREFKLQSCVIGVSGGIDSAVAVSIFNKAKTQHKSPIRKIIPVLAPIHNTGATNQKHALKKGLSVITNSNLLPYTIDLSKIHKLTKCTVDSAMGVHGEPWAAGQLVSNIRTPVFYYITSLLTQENSPAIVIGTTNRDEGSYIGFFGKASDNMNDLQIISDIHKSEVIKVAKALDVPQNIIQATPTGDTYDGQTDEEMTGLPYDLIELSILFKNLDPEEQKSILEKLPIKSQELLNRILNRTDELNRINKHKYLENGHIHLDIYPRTTPGGWKNHKPQASSSNNSWVSPFEMKPINFSHTTPNIEKLKDISTIKNLLSTNECSQIINQLKNVTWIPVGVNGKLPCTTDIGSWRCTSYYPPLAKIIWKRLANKLDLRFLKEDAHPYWDKHPIWRPVGINPLFRFIRYENNGFLIPHYDSPFIKNDKVHTQMSLLISIDNSSTVGGATRLIQDPVKYGTKDWDCPPTEEQVAVSIKANSGEGLLFDHGLLHDSERISQGTKLIIRTDVYFEKCGYLN